MTYFVNIDAPC